MEFLSVDLSNIDSTVFEILPLSNVLASEKYKNVVTTHYNTVAQENSLTALNTAFSTQGVFVRIGKIKFQINLYNYIISQHQTKLLSLHNQGT